MAEQLKKGDIVRLKSGSPKMTVDVVASDGKVFCVWFLQDGKAETWSGPHHGSFPPDALEK